MRDLLRRWFARTIADLDLGPWLRSAFIHSSLHSQAQRHPLLVIALGKAARSMTNALVAALPGARMRGLVVPPEPDDAPLPPFEVIAGGHPLPTDGSIRAAARALELVRSAQPDEVAVFLVSGGGSAMFELPADPSVRLDELRELYRALVGSGAGILGVNAVRAYLSAVKGGRLALAATGAHYHHTFVISDVPRDVGGSGVASSPTLPAQPPTPEACRAVLDRFDLWSSVPPALCERVRRGDAGPSRAAWADDLGRRSEVHVVQDESAARYSLRQHAKAAGILVVDDGATDEWPCERAAAHLLARLDGLRRRHPGRAVAIVAGGELSVPLPAKPGTGGRNQQFALACARLIRGRPITVLSCGTDGIDGNSPAAGAVVDGTTMARARQLGFDVHDHLARCDAFPLLQALGDTVVTGPTGTNVRDLRVLVHG